MRPKKSFYPVVLFFIFSLVLMYGFPARAEDEAAADSGAGADVILLVDVSGSMPISDPERAAPAAVNAAIDLIVADGGRAGLVTFSGTLKYIQPPTDFTDGADRESLRRRVDRLEYNGYTDIGLALQKAAELIAGEETLNNPMVLLFTDGKIEINPNTYRRTPEQSMADAEDALAKLNEAGAPVYAVGLDAGGGLDEDMLALVTGGGTDRMRVTTEPGELGGLLAAAYESRILSAAGAEQNPAQSAAALTPEGATAAPEPSPALPTETAGTESPSEVPPVEPAEQQNAAPPAEPAEVQPPLSSPGPIDLEHAEESPEEPGAEPGGWHPSPGVLLALVALALTAVVINILWLSRVLRNKNINPPPFTFDVTVVTPLGSDKIPTVSLEAEIDKNGVTLGDLAAAAFDGRDLPADMGDGINGVRFFPKSKRGAPALKIVNEGGMEISDADNTILTGGRIAWKANARLTFTGENEMTRLEIEYSITRL